LQAARRRLQEFLGRLPALWQEAGQRLARLPALCREAGQRLARLPERWQRNAERLGPLQLRHASARRLVRLPALLLPYGKTPLSGSRPNEARWHKAAVRALLRSEASATFVRVLAYLSALGVLTLAAGHFVSSTPLRVQSEIPAAAEWRQVAKPYPAFSLPMSELTESGHDYALRRHIVGGRQDIMSWGEPKGSAPHLMIEIYRPAAELTHFSAAEQEIAARIDRLGAGSVTSAGEMETKFGTASLVEFSLSEPVRQCLGFVHAEADPHLQILGWHCVSGSTAVERNTTACALDRLTLVSAASEPKMREFFARAELKRNFCGQRSHLLTPTPKLGPSAPPPEPRSAGVMARRAFAKSPAGGLLR